MAVNKVNLANGETLVDLTGDSVTAETLTEGTTAHDASGNPIIGKMPTTNVLYTEQTLTEAQKAQARQNIGIASTEEIVQEVITALGTPVFGTVDEENNIILSGVLADGTYTLKYEDDNGIQTEIGTMKVGNVVEYGFVYGRTQRVGGSDYTMYYSTENGSTNYRLIYQTTGEMPFANGSISGEATSYYPLKVPNGKTKVKVAFPNLASNKSVLMQVDGMTLSNGLYTRVSSSGWIIAGVYEYEIGNDIPYIDLVFRNNSYDGLDNYDFTGFTVTWE